MHLCFVYKYYPLENNLDSGIGKYIFDLVQQLKKGNEITVITTSSTEKIIKQKNLTIYGMRYPSTKHELYNLLRHLTNVCLKLTKIAKRKKIDLIEFVNWESEGYLFTTFPNLWLKIPVTIRVLTPGFLTQNNIQKYANKMKTIIEKKFIEQKNNILISPSINHSQFIRRSFNLKKHLKVIPLGIDLTKTTVAKNPPLVNELIILFVGRLEKRKGIDILINAIPKVLKRINNARFVIAGRDNSPPGWIEDLKNSIPFNYLTNVNFLGYIKDPVILNKLRSKVDICVIPSRYESFGLTVIEPMIYKKAVIASSVGGIREIIKDGVNGILVPPGNSSKLALEIINLAKNKKLRHRLGINAYKMVRSKWDANLMAEKSLEFYRSVVERKVVAGQNNKLF